MDIYSIYEMSGAMFDNKNNNNNNNNINNNNINNNSNSYQYHEFILFFLSDYLFCLMLFYG